MNMNAMLMAAMIAACVVLASGADTVNVGGIDVVSDAAEFTQISNDVCELYDDMTDKPIDFDKTEAAYTEERTIDGYNYSLQELAQEGVAAFDQDQGKYWDTFAAYYDDEQWMDTFIESAISGEASTDPESVRKVYVQKEVRDSVMISMMLSFLDDAHSELENASGASIDDVKQNARYDLYGDTHTYIQNEKRATLHAHTDESNFSRTHAKKIVWNGIGSKSFQWASNRTDMSECVVLGICSDL